MSSGDEQAIGFEFDRRSTRSVPGVADLSSQKPPSPEILLDVSVMPDKSSHLQHAGMAVFYGC
jgi:hypothetical protein